MNILFIHQFFTTENEPGEVRHIEMFKYLLEKGYSFTVIGGALNYMTGKLFDDFSGIFQYREPVKDGIKLIRTWIPPLYRKGFAGKLLCYIVFLFLSIVASLKTEKFDLVLTTSPSLFTALAGYIISKIKGVPFILEIRDLWPKVAVEMGAVKNKHVIWFASALELFLYKKARRIVVITEGYADYIHSRGIERTKIDVVHNGVDQWMLDYEEPEEMPEELKTVKDKFLVMYVGAIGKFNYLQDFLEAVELLGEREKFAFLFIGEGGEKENLIRYAKEKNLENVFFTGSKLRSEIPLYLCRANLTAAIYPQIPTGKVLLQNKVLDYMALGKTVLLVAEEGDTSRIIEEAGCGFRVDRGPEALAKKLEWAEKNREICNEMGQKGRYYAGKHLNRKKLAEKMHNVLRSEMF